MSMFIPRFLAGVLVCLVSCSALVAEEAGAAKPKAVTVTQDGLSVTVAPAKDSFAANEPIVFDVTFKNVSEKAFQLFDAMYWIYDLNSNGTWACVMRDITTGKEYRPTVLVRPLLERIAAPVTLEPGKSHEVKMDLTNVSYQPVGGAVQDDKPERAGPRIRPGLPPRLTARPLPPATYQLVLTLTFIKSAGANSDENQEPAPFWTGTVKVETAAFKLGAHVAAGEARGGWQKLFADEDWYHKQRGQERLFTGVLNAIKNDPNMETTLQRTSLYSLDKRTIYTGAKKVDALDKLVGKVVTIRGKIVEMELEGRMVREIWPAAVKEAKEPLHPIEMHPGIAPPERLPRDHTLPVEPAATD